MDVNFLAVVAAAIVSMIIGSIWYGPLFGRQFKQAMGMDTWSPEKQAEEKKKMGKLYFMQLIASLVMFYVLAAFVGKTGDMGVSGGVVMGFWVWLGFVMPTQLGNSIWGGSMTLFWIGTTNMFVTLLAAGAIIGAWS